MKLVKVEIVNGIEITKLDFTDDVNLRLALIKNDLEERDWGLVDYVYERCKDIEKTQKIITIMFTIEQ